MRFSSYLVLLGCCGATLAAPVEQKVLSGNRPRVIKNPYTPSYRDPYDKKVDSIGDKLQPLPYVSAAYHSHFGYYSTTYLQLTLDYTCLASKR